MKVRYLAGLSLLLWSISAFSMGESFAHALRPVLTEQEFDYIYEVSDDLSLQIERIQELLRSTEDAAKKAVLLFALSQALQFDSSLRDALGQFN